MKKELFKGKLDKRRLLATLIPIAFAVVLLFELWFMGFAEKKQIFIDLTSEGLYTLTDGMRKECEYLNGEDKEVKIIFCADPETLRQNERSRVVYYMCLALQKRFDGIKVETVNLKTNPTAVNEYKTTSLSEITATDVIVTSGDAFRIAPMDAFWATNSENEPFSYNGEFKMASIFHSLTAKNGPVAYFVINHGEQYYDTEKQDHPGNKQTYSLFRLLTERGLIVKTLDLSKQEVPKDCSLLIINNPQTDYLYEQEQGGSYGYISETEKLDRYLVREQGSMMVAKDYKLSLPNLEDFLYEWGFELSDEVLSDEGAHLSNAADPDDFTNLVGQYITEENTYAYAIYGDYASLSSAPRFVFSDAGEVKCAYDLGTAMPEVGSDTIERHYAPFFSTTAQGKTLSENGLVSSVAAVRDICAIGLRFGVDSTTAARTYSYIFCANSASFFSEQILSNHSFANFDVTSALVENISREDVYASIDLGGSSANSASYGGKRLQKTDIATASIKVYASDGSVVKTNEPITAGAKAAIIVIAASLPMAAAVLCAVTYLRRRYK